jgi:hypothetical protein
MAKPPAAPPAPVSTEPTPEPAVEVVPIAKAELAKLRADLAEALDANNKIVDEYNDLHGHAQEQSKALEILRTENAQLHAMIDQMPAIAEPVSTAIDMRDPRCTDRHRQNCVCTGAMRGPIK